MRKFIFYALSLFVLSCTSQSDFEKGKKILEQQGFIDVQKTGVSLLCCDKKEQFTTGFTCISKEGKVVSGCFCSSFGKGMTVRFN